MEGAGCPQSEAVGADEPSSSVKGARTNAVTFCLEMSRLSLKLAVPINATSPARTCSGRSRPERFAAATAPAMAPWKAIANVA